MLEELEEELWNLEELEEAGEDRREVEARVREVRGRVEHLGAVGSGALLHSWLLCSSTSSNLYTAHKRVLGTPGKWQG